MVVAVEEEDAVVPSATAAVLSRANKPQSAAAASGVETSTFLLHAVYRAVARRRRGLGVAGRIRLSEEVEKGCATVVCRDPLLFCSSL